MKRFIDLRGQEAGYRFAWYDTVRDEFEQHSGEMAWDTFGEFAEAYQGDDLTRYRGLTPAWALHDTFAAPGRADSAT